uniref:Pentraxin family member n=2 Tax=Xiphophorus maculatus TaxID=8083 RepID=A0A3B5QGG7_XIPMA
MLILFFNQMKVLSLLVLITACAARTQDISGRMFTFPLETNRAYVKFNTSRRDFNAVTVCHRSFTDLKRDHMLFSLSTPNNPNDFLIFWDNTNKEMEAHIKNKKAEYGGRDYKLNTWHSICTTWDAETGLAQLWFNGQPSIRKFTISGSNIGGPVNIIVGQEQDSHGGGFDMKQSFVGMMSDVHMWDYVLSACEIQNYVDERNYTPGNVLNWRALDYQIVDKVLLEHTTTVCY